MSGVWTVVACTLASCIGAIVGGVVALRKRAYDVVWFWHRQEHHGRSLIRLLIEAHFQPTSPDNITISERKFPFRVRADLQRAIDGLFVAETSISYFCGVEKEYCHEGLKFSNLLVDGNSPAVSVPPQYEEVDIGESEPVRCLKNGLWFLEEGESKYAVLLTPAGHYGQVTGITFQIATVNNQEGMRVTQRFFKHLEDSILRAESYRGKVLSLELSEHSYSGESTGITVHRLRTVAREQVILPRKTIELLGAQRHPIRRAAGTTFPLAASDQEGHPVLRATRDR